MQQLDEEPNTLLQ